MYTLAGTIYRIKLAALMLGSGASSRDLERVCVFFRVGLVRGTILLEWRRPIRGDFVPPTRSNAGFLGGSDGDKGGGGAVETNPLWGDKLRAGSALSSGVLGTGKDAETEGKDEMRSIGGGVSFVGTGEENRSTGRGESLLGREISIANCAREGRTKFVMLELDDSSVKGSSANEADSDSSSVEQSMAVSVSSDSPKRNSSSSILS